MAKRKRYTDEQRASAVVMLEALGYPDESGVLQAVANKTGISRQNLSNWFKRKHNPPPQELLQEKKRDLTADMEDILFGFMDELQARIRSGNLQDESLNYILQGMGISFDKVRLLNGESTDNRAVAVQFTSVEIVKSERD